MGIKNTNIVIIGAGILGTALSYIISSLSDAKIILIEQENKVGFHASSRNTGKVHAPFIYDPEKKKVLAKAALFGYEFWKEYCKIKKISFKEDGIIEVATNDKGTKTIYKHLEWGINNGLGKKEIEILGKKEIEKIEPNVSCESAILCNKDASVDYGEITQALSNDASKNKVDIIMNSKVVEIKYTPQSNEEIYLKIKNFPHNDENEIKCDFLINAAGGSSLDLVNIMKMNQRYINFHFRGEYWIAPQKYRHLTNHSIYSVPEFQQFPFLDPHWIIKANGNREIGPNAVPVFSQFGYDIKTNLKEFFPNIYKLAKRSEIKKIKKLFFKKEIAKLISSEILSSLSKRYMINRVKKFLPSLKSKEFITRGTAGIRSNLIDKNGNFILNPIFLNSNNTLHILNYNSPGATGAFSIGFAMIFKLIEEGRIKNDKEINTHIFKEKLILDCIKEVNIVFFKI
ncbi:MAG: FAD-dependent oxidoreductase [Nitrosopumilus sp.]|nr:FAD-dependent oxidoreductase [Nitrosopumilus sp.]